MGEHLGGCPVDHRHAVAALRKRLHGTDGCSVQEGWALPGGRCRLCALGVQGRGCWRRRAWVIHIHGQAGNRDPFGRLLPQVTHVGDGGAFETLLLARGAVEIEQGSPGRKVALPRSPGANQLAQSALAAAEIGIGKSNRRLVQFRIMSHFFALGRQARPGQPARGPLRLAGRGLPFGHLGPGKAFCRFDLGRRGGRRLGARCAARASYRGWTAARVGCKLCAGLVLAVGLPQRQHDGVGLVAPHGGGLTGPWRRGACGSGPRRIRRFGEKAVWGETLSPLHLADLVARQPFLPDAAQQAEFGQTHGIIVPFARNHELKFRAVHAPLSGALRAVVRIRPVGDRV